MRIASKVLFVAVASLALVCPVEAFGKGSGSSSRSSSGSRKSNGASKSNKSSGSSSSRTRSYYEGGSTLTGTYIRKDGTIVHGYVRTRPDTSKDKEFKSAGKYKPKLGSTWAKR